MGMHSEIPTKRRLSRRHFSCVRALVCAGFFVFAHHASAQDIAEAARQEAARKAAASQKQTHVYTNEDLSRPQILTPEDRAPIEARRKDHPKPVLPETSPQDAAAPNSAAAESLGEIARRLRSEKAARKAEQARKLAPPAPFRMELPEPPVLARPRPSIGPLPVAAAPTPVLPARRNTGMSKRDPFSRAAVPVVPPPSVSTVAGTSIASARASLSPSAAAVTASAAPHASRAPTGFKPEVRIQSGDTLWNLSRRYLGHGSRWPELVGPNPGVGDPRHMKLGTLLRLPPNLPYTPAGERNRREDVARAGPRPDGSAESVGRIGVRPGDSLWRLALKRYGNGSGWRCLAAANPAVRDVNRIYPGQQLNLPATCSATTSSSQP